MTMKTDSIIQMFSIQHGLKKPMSVLKKRLSFPHKKVSHDLTEKKQDLTEMSIILMVLNEIYHNQLRKSWFNSVNICQA